MPYVADFVIIILLAFVGFLIASYIRHHKKNIKEALICPLRANCDTVIHSDYSKFFGFSVENLGMFYYGFIALTYGLAIIFPSLYSSFVAYGLLVATILAFMFSIYLTLVQAFILKNWCTWCIISALICLTIFSIAISDSSVLGLLGF
ncbi:MAG: hypothetical protein A3B86_02895 [Candidatus Yanofskybacteria bacterium RIFCSPHIGHO2_02_FULL_38_22b]|uniref:Vitamin K epoxide reductase domain-containing protein n=1 Tax=Candidatus Yanofskybacteria bacterium RIFCSPHIGHO2_02_FULL_38_22b TaxID=1802673 RepID=A0A1F8F3H6_9BACT|nr:MAG: hypothetical protein A2816_02485 [Candidatus Yanofskybacteria bacterium RIFCSPHIGHO2_01_FULL_39_44]OGN06819.1 MAG: hypothetical protein A3B86_02895 [Candidatus Yanofskybacteria bacterium RIFCSPHIGHO2_02_FULL_38_22b]OGN20714.1 MAG: hypothetical protein A2910_00855 [Candidatus Yanofskybacteria bacterium RIFCSPLOWO2_01_FULL_39_28]